MVKSAENLTPRGLQNTFSSNEVNLEHHSLDSFLLSRRRGDELDSYRNSINADKPQKGGSQKVGSNTQKSGGGNSSNHSLSS